MLDKVSKVWNTVRYMTPRQWKYRLYYTSRSLLPNRVPKQTNHVIYSSRLPAFYSSDTGNKSTVIADGILNNEIPTVSKMNILFRGDWDLKGEEYRLVCFRLNSFRWLLDLSDAYKATGDGKYINKGKELIKDWQKRCGSIITGDKWNAYVIAERITNWICFCSEYAADDLDDYAKIIYPQVQELKNSLEYQLGANHLLSEAKALMYAGVFLCDDGLYKKGKNLLIAEAKEQFLKDGGHYEQSISYHVESLQQFFEAYAIMRTVDDKDAVKFVEIMRGPYQFLNGMIGANGKIPLFNDSAYDYPFFDAADFLATSSYIYSAESPKGRKGAYYKRWGWLDAGEHNIDWNDKTLFEETNFVHYRFENAGKKYSFFMDCGNNGPDYNLGHTHADALSILLCSEDRDILVDSGVFTYRPCSERNECRSTRAHNTVEVDGKSSAEIWSAFRVARRGHTYISDVSRDEEFRIKASHDGYRKVLKDPVDHIREVKLNKWRIEIYDTLDGKGEHKAISRYHIGPECTVEKIDSNSCRINGNILVSSDQNIRISDCNVASMFGLAEKTKCLEIEFQNKTKTTIMIG